MKAAQGRVLTLESHVVLLRMQIKPIMNQDIMNEQGHLFVLLSRFGQEGLKLLRVH